jgi:hypothetical protein
MTIENPPIQTAPELTSPAGPSDGGRGIVIKHPNRAHEVRTNKGSVRYSRQGLKGDDDQPLMVLTVQLGSVQLRQPRFGGPRWRVTFADPVCAEAHPIAYAARFARAHLELLAQAAHLLPDGLVAPRPLSSRCAAERELLKMLLPPISSLPQRIQDIFGDLLARLAYEIYYAARNEDARSAARAEKEKAAELLAKFLTLPDGTVLTDRYGLQMIATISESGPMRGKRRLQITMGAEQGFFREIDGDVIEGLCLLTVERAKALDPRLVSAHDIINALRVNRGLDERFPEWA